MSMDSWKKEFYPVEASLCSHENAVQHSLRKWGGLLKKNMKKHGLLVDDFSTIADCDGNTFDIDDSSCALCLLYYRHNVVDSEKCAACPLYEELGRSCDSSGDYTDTSKSAPYAVFCRTGDARPMVYALRRIISKQNSK